MNSRRGKKGSITKRIAQIDRIVGDGGSRSQVRYLIEALSKVQQAMQAVCDELNTLAPDTDSEYLDNENLRIDTCISEAKGYLERRRNDPPSTDPLTQSWVDQNAAEMDILSVTDTGLDEVNNVADDLAAMSATGRYNEANMQSSSSTVLKPSHLFWKPDVQQSTFIPSEQRFVDSNSRHIYTQPPQSEGQYSYKPQSSSTMNYIPSATTFAVSAAAAATGTRATPSMGGGLSYHQYNARPANPYSSVPPLRQPQPQQQQQQQHQHQYVYCSPPNQFGTQQNQVDSWIDDLTVNNVVVVPNPLDNNRENDIAMGFFIQQSLPRMDVPVFEGSPFAWVEFITKFRDLIHDQPYLTVLRKSTLLIQHLEGEPKRSVQGFPNNASGYVFSLQRLKFLFGQRGKIAQATILSITQGKAVPDHNAGALSDLYYSISNFLVTLTQLNYASDVYSCQALRQVVLRLPRRLQDKWAENSYSIRLRDEELSLVHLERWLQTRVMALMES